MNRKKLIPLLLFLLLLLLIICVWCHSSDIVKSRTVSSSNVSSIATPPVVKQDINFKFLKNTDNIELRGKFPTDEDVKGLHATLGTAQFNNLSTIDKDLLAKEGVISLTEKLLVPFNDKYRSGSISYENDKLTIEGVVDNDADKNLVSALLANSLIHSKNNTQVVVPGPTAEELAKKEAEEKARLLALAEKEAEDKAKLLALAKKEAEEKAKLLALVKKEAEEKARLKAKAFETKIKEIIDVEKINFEVNKNTLTTQSINTITHIAVIMKKHPNVNVEIAGYTDSSGDSERNLALSQKRVNTVKEKLMALQIDEKRLTAVGYGAKNPLVSNDTKENRRKNRRVEFKVIGE